MVSNPNGREVAIVGMACRFPYANTPAQYWDNLEQGRNCIREIPADRWSIAEHYHPAPGTPGKSNSKWGGFLEDVRGCDAAFFGIPEDEAAFMDPQHRIVLELAHEALESAGYAGRRRADLRVGVFIGISQSSYEEFTRPLLFSGRSNSPNLVADNLRNLAAGRIAHSLNLTGPNLAVDTACSSSLVALHYARLSLLAGECNLALAGGISLNLSATPFVAFSSAGALSPSATPYLFDGRADGFVLGEGGGVVLLTLLSRAQRERDPILAIIKGSAVNNDGRSHGLMTPNPVGQQEVMAAAYRDADLDPDTVSYIEAHGTGTRIGDAVEARSLSRFFPIPNEGTKRYVGSVKTNIGHLLSSAGIASVIKVVLALQHRRIPPSLNHEQPRANLRLERYGLVVNTEPLPWHAPAPLRAGINGFGFGGTNAHLILEEPPSPAEPHVTDHASALWMISAASEAALRQSARDLATYLRALPLGSWSAAAYSAAAARDEFPWRAALVGHERLPDRLDSLAEHGATAEGWTQHVKHAGPPPLAFVFDAGDGRAFGQQLYYEEPAFRRLCDELVAQCRSSDKPEEEANQALISQIALAQLLIKWNIVPRATLGLGRGDLAAACIAGRLSVTGVACAAAALDQSGSDHSTSLSLSTQEAGPSVGWLSVLAGGWVGEEQGLLELSAPGSLETTIPDLIRDLHGAGIKRLLVIGATDELAQQLEEAAHQTGIPLEVDALFQAGPVALHALYRTLAKLWTSGYPLDRLAVDAERTPQRIPVPTYPFQRKSYWVETVPTPLASAADEPEAEATHLRWLHQVTWPECPPKTDLPADAPLRGTLLIVAAEREDAEQVALRLQSPDTRAEAMLLSEVPERLPACRERPWMLYIDAPESVGETPPHNATRLVWPLAQLASLLQRAPASHRPHGIYVITSASQYTGSDREALRPARALVAGLGLALNAELGIPTQIVDTDYPRRDDGWLAAVRSELVGPPEAAVIVWRVGHRHRRSLAPFDTLSATPGQNRPAIRKNGVYLITGGAGAVGSAIARGLALEFAPGLILVGRKPSGAVPERADLLDKLRWAGARAEYVACDLTDAAQVGALMDWIRSQYGSLTGIIHAAGVIRPGRLAGKTEADLAAVLAPKVVATELLLESATHAGIRPELFVAFSSIAALLPGFSGGLGDYAAANACLDALVLAQPAGEMRTVTINWTIWSETGRGSDQLLLEHLARQGLAGINSDEGYRVFRAAVASPLQQVVVVNRTGVQGLQATSGADQVSVPQWQERAPAPRTGKAVMQRTLSGDIVAIQQILLELLAEELEVAPAEIAVDAAFTALNLDSMGALDLVLKLEQAGFGTLPATLFFEYNTIERLAAYLGQQVPEWPQAQQADTPVASPDAAVMPAVPAAEAFPLGPVQLAFYTNYRLRPAEVAYAFVRQTVQGPLDVAQLQQAVDRLIVNHPMLRTTFGLSDEQRRPQQVTYPAGTPGLGLQIEVLEVPGDPSRLDDAIVNRPLNLGGREVARIIVVRAPQPGQWHLLLHFHHIVADGWSLSQLAQELWLHYFAGLGYPAIEPSPPRSTMHDYVDVIQAEAGSPEREQLLAWWKDELARAAQHAPRLPFDTQPQDSGVRQRVLHFSLDPSLSARLQKMAADNELSLFHVLLAVYYRCLAEWTGQKELVVGVAEARRDYPLPDIQRLVGCLADVFPLYMALEADEPIRQVAIRVRDNWLRVHRHTHLSSIDLVRLMPQHRHDAEPQLISPASFSFARFPTSFSADAPVQILELLGRTATAATRLSLVCWEFDNRMHFTCNYPAHLFRDITIAAFAEEFKARARQAGDEVDIPPQLGAPAAVHAPFLSAIANHWQTDPGRRAVSGDGYMLTYGELARQVGYWTGILQDAGITAGDRVAFLGEPGAEAIIALLAVLHLGAVWVPLDPGSPAQRLGTQIETVTASVLLYTSEMEDTAHALPVSQATRLKLRHDTPGADLRGTNPVDPADIAYIIFTSGTTGQPKGVPITRQALNDYLRWAVETFQYAERDLVILVTSLAFDASLRQCLAPLMAGSAVRPVEAPILKDPRALLAVLETERVTVWSSVPSLWLRLLAHVERQAQEGNMPALLHLRLIQLGGEALAAGPVHRWQNLFGQRARFVNLYGPTEATIHATCYFLPEQLPVHAVSVPIGTALPGRALRIVAENGARRDPGEVGELWIGGPALSPGYWDDDTLTEQKFVVLDDGQRFFKTGDLVVAQPDGSLVFVGRKDSQVKVRGHRIELEEIEHVLAGHSQISQAAVVLVEEQAAQRLVAFLEVAGEIPTVGAVRAYLQEQLPEYMIPHHFQALKRLPLRPNGKVDRARLTVIAESGPPTPLDAGPGEGNKPLTEREQSLATIWQRVLGVPSVSREDDFFAAGGDSLKILEVLVDLESQGLTVPSAAELYRHRTLQAQASVLIPRDTGAEQRSFPGTPAPFPLSPAQTGFLMTRSLTPPLATTWSAYFWLEGHLDVDLFNRALALLLERHPMLRTVCLPEERPPLQTEIAPAQPLPVRYEDLSAELEAPPDRLEEMIAARLQEERSHLFDLGSWPLMRMRLCRVAPDRHIWFVAADHFIGDAFSGWIFGTELLHIYDTLVDGRPIALPRLQSTFRDYVPLALERESQLDAETTAFWQQMFRDGYQLPVNWYHGREPEPGEEEWLHAVYELDATDFTALKAAAAIRSATAHETLLALYFHRLMHLTGQSDLVVGTAVAGRDYPLPSLMQIFGSFATLLPVRVQLDPTSTLEEQCRAVSTLFGKARIYKRSPRQIARLAGAGVPLTALTGLQFMFSFMDFEHLHQPRSEHLTIWWDRSQTELQPPRLGTDIVLTGRTLGGSLRLTFTAGAHAMTKSGLEDFVTAFRKDVETLLHQRRPAAAVARRTQELDAALIGYLPSKDEVRGVLNELQIPVDLETVRDLLFPEAQPRLLEKASLWLGCTATVCLPWYADELDGLAPEVLARAVTAAGSIAAYAGARCVSMAGMLPARTRYGFAVLEALAPLNPLQVTTGHSLTAVTVVKNLQHAIEQVGYRPSELAIAFLGLGAIGSGVLNLYLSEAEHPRRIILCDLAASRAHLEELARQLLEMDFTGQREIVLSEGIAPEGLYTADIIVGASSRPNILEVERLLPGTVVVDDSFPHCFAPTAAIGRMQARRDVLLVSAGLLDCGPVERELVLPAGAPAAAGRVLNYFPPAGSPGCQMEALLQARQPELPLTQGLVTRDSVQAYWQAVETLGLRAVPLHLGRYVPDPALIHDLKRVWRTRKAAVDG